MGTGKVEPEGVTKVYLNFERIGRGISTFSQGTLLRESYTEADQDEKTNLGLTMGGVLVTVDGGQKNRQRDEKDRLERGVRRHFPERNMEGSR